MRRKLVLPTRARALALIVTIALVASPAAAASKLLATTGNGATGPSTLLEIDPNTGATLQTIGPVGYIVNGMEFDPATGKLYGSTSWRDTNHNGLIEIDMTTGAGTPIGPSGWGGIPGAPNGGFTAVTNITIDSAGQMYGWLDPIADDLVSIDKNAGIATWVGVSGVGTAANGLDFDASDTLYMIQFGSVYQVNPGTGVATPVGFYPSTGCCAHHGDFEPATNHYYAIGPDPFGASGKFLEIVDVSTFSVVGTVPLQAQIHVLTFVDAVLEVEIDIKPGSDPNGINPGSKGKIPVAILTTSIADGDSVDFDAWDVDDSTLAFGPNGAPISHAQGHAEDVDGDGDLDMVVHFKTQETGIACGDTEATLTGETFGGQAIEGTDSVKTAGCKSAQKTVLRGGTPPNDPLADRAQRRTLRREAREQARR